MMMIIIIINNNLISTLFLDNLISFEHYVMEPYNQSLNWALVLNPLAKELQNFPKLAG